MLQLGWITLQGEVSEDGKRRCPLLCCTAGVFAQILNPVLVNQFGLKFTAVSMVTTLHKICALVASLCAIPLAKHGRDVNLMVCLPP